MKRILAFILCISMIVSVSACTPAPEEGNLIIGTLPPPPTETTAAPSPTDTTATVAPSPTDTVTVAPSPTDTATAAPSPTDTTAPSDSPEVTATAEPSPEVTEAPSPSPSPTVETFGETPDQAGSGDVLFDIYKSKALVDLNKDGTPEEITFTAGTSSSTLKIGSATYTVNLSGLAQLFAVTDIDIGDNTLELAFTDKYSTELADTEFPYTYLYWWTGSDIKRMGSLMNVKFAGAWRTGFDPTDNFDAHGSVMCLARTTQLTDLWYTGKYSPNGTDRKLKETLYATKPLFNPSPLTLKAGKACLLLAHGNSTFFGSSYSVMWDYASYPHSDGRVINPTADIIIIAQAGETLNIVGVLGPNWVKLQTSDGYKGWIKVIDGKVQGYWQVMHYTAEDIFSGIVVAG